MPNFKPFFSSSSGLWRSWLPCQLIETMFPCQLKWWVVKGCYFSRSVLETALSSMNSELYQVWQSGGCPTNLSGWDLISSTLNELDGFICLYNTLIGYSVPDSLSYRVSSWPERVHITSHIPNLFSETSGRQDFFLEILYIFAFDYKYFKVLHFFFFNILRMKFGFVSGIPKTTLRLDDSLERSPDSEKLLSSCLWFYHSKKMPI